MKDGLKFGIPVVIGASVIALGFGSCYSAVTKDRPVTATICDKESVSTGESGHEYRVYTDGETYKVTDYVLGEGKRFNSGTFYSHLKRGEKYNLKVRGFRIGILSSFQNIVSADPIGPNPSACQ